MGKIMFSKIVKFVKTNKKAFYVILLAALITAVLLVIPGFLFKSYKFFITKIISYKLFNVYSGYLILILTFLYIFFRFYKKFIKEDFSQQITELKGTISELEKKNKFYEEQLVVLKNHFDKEQK